MRAAVLFSLFVVVLCTGLKVVDNCFCRRRIPQKQEQPEVRLQPVPGVERRQAQPEERLQLEPGVYAKLQQSLNRGGRGGRYGQHFKALKNGGPGDHYHHIIPDHIVTKQLAAGATEQEVEDFINLNTIRSTIREIFSNPEVPKDRHGEVIHASISWYPNNIALGPDPATRKDDPGRGVDYPILVKQSMEYQVAAATLESLDQSTPARKRVIEAKQRYQQNVANNQPIPPAQQPRLPDLGKLPPTQNPPFTKDNYNKTEVQN